jgi:hypothetical protein
MRSKKSPVAHRPNQISLISRLAILWLLNSSERVSVVKMLGSVRLGWVWLVMHMRRVNV